MEGKSCVHKVEMLIFTRPSNETTEVRVKTNTLLFWISVISAGPTFQRAIMNVLLFDFDSWKKWLKS